MTHCGTKDLYTRRLHLRPYRLEDAQAVFDSWAGDPVVTDRLDWAAHSDVQVTRRLIQMWVESYQSPTVYHWCIEYNGKIAGDMMVCKWNQEDSWCELGYCLTKEYWGQGLAAEALCRVAAYLFESVGFHRIQLRHEEDNAASGRVMQKCGFRYEGTLRHAKRSRTGEWKNICCYSLLSTDKIE